MGNFGKEFIYDEENTIFLIDRDCDAAVLHYTVESCDQMKKKREYICRALFWGVIYLQTMIRLMKIIYSEVIFIIYKL